MCFILEVTPDYCSLQHYVFSLYNGIRFYSVELNVQTLRVVSFKIILYQTFIEV